MKKLEKRVFEFNEERNIQLRRSTLLHPRLELDQCPSGPCRLLRRYPLHKKYKTSQQPRLIYSDVVSSLTIVSSDEGQMNKFRKTRLCWTHTLEYS